MLCGLDEAGVGSLMSNLVASAVILGESVDVELLRDSKKITNEKKRAAIEKHIMSTCMVGIGIVTNQEIDDLGMADCRRIVFTRALEDLEKNTGVRPSKIIVDGTLFKPWKNIPYECIPKADATVPSVSAASIVAKSTRDRHIHDICAYHPEYAKRYGWSTNKGYPSQNHRDAIKLHGRCEYHRKSYRLKEEK